MAERLFLGTFTMPCARGSLHDEFDGNVSHAWNGQRLKAFVIQTKQRKPTNGDDEKSTENEKSRNPLQTPYRRVNTMELDGNSNDKRRN